MKWIFPSVALIVAAYMWHLDKSNSTAAYGVALVSAAICFVLEWKDRL